MVKKSKTFVEITNVDIYKKLETISDDVIGIKEHLKTLNGSVKTNRENISKLDESQKTNNKWLIGIGLTVLLSIIGFIIEIAKGG